MSAKIIKALHEVMSKVSYVQKSGKNAFHGYKYAGEADLLEKLRPAMLEVGLMLIPSITDVSPIDDHGVTTVRMQYTLVHKDGDIWPHHICAAGQGGDRNKNGVGDKGLYKAITGANKYLLFKLFQIETGDDPESDTQDEATPTKRQNPHVTRPEDIYDHSDADVLPRPDIDVKPLSKAKANPLFKELQDGLWKCGTVDQMQVWSDANKDKIGQLPDDWYKMLRGVYVEHKQSIITQNTGDDMRMAG
jgi:hypothetical protein